MDKSKPKLYALWECVDHIEVPYVDKAYGKLINYIYQNESQKDSKYLYSDPASKEINGFRYLFINKYKQISEKMYLEDIDSITTRYNDISGVKDVFNVPNYEKRNQIVVGRKYNKTLKTYPILLSEDLIYVDPAYVEDSIVSRVNNYDDESFEFFQLLSNNESFCKDPSVSVLLDNINIASRSTYYDGGAGLGLYQAVRDFYDLWVYNGTNYKELNYNNLRKLGLYIKEMENKYPKVKQLSFFD